ncbi:amidohydrolase family protein [Marixanthomonas sp. SCSIO 43207]|uniref:amidohydrolase family protein n=1 Tax=Marixanthomonas sp. SCSIO 43207 TaxID=2779360 RepID=UPI001CA96959|nr:amidohydrolase family protein [Marixanthomonas sp. SCSIO 43207]UAB81131.1 amidohydrolase family protein [Marixanthomonas sp. SCSIO 43207]
MKFLNKLFILVAICSSSISIAQQTPAPKQTEAITIQGATAHIGNGDVIENCTIVFEDGKITNIGSTVTPKGQVIDATGKHVYPGFIAPVSTLGLGEIDAVRPTIDDDEIGEMIPNIRSLIAYNAESQVVESMRPNGVLLAQITPQGGRISGTSSVVQLDAWNWEDAAIKVDDGIHMNWPNSFRRGRWWLGEPRGYKPNKDYPSDIDQVVSFLVNAKAYKQTDNQPKNEAFKAMKGLFDGSKKLFIHVDGEKEIIDAVTTAKQQGVKNVVIVGGYEAYKVTAFLKSNNIPILVRRVHTTPEREDDDYDLPYKLPKLLVDAGLLVGLQANGRMERMNTRNLPFYAGHLMGQGMNKEQALQLITGNTAKILGIDSTYGTLEKGKSATLFISEGNALDMRTNILTHAFINGRDVSLETHQTKLYKRYMNKYEEGKK